MDWKYLLTSFEGRINRQPYWLAILAMLIVFVVIFGALSVVLPFLNGWIFSVPIFVLVAYFSFALGIKRLHDRNKSGHWMWLFAGVPMATNLISFFAKLDPAGAAGMTLGIIGLAL